MACTWFAEICSCFSAQEQISPNHVQAIFSGSVHKFFVAEAISSLRAGAYRALDKRLDSEGTLLTLYFLCKSRSNHISLFVD